MTDVLPSFAKHHPACPQCGKPMHGTAYVAAEREGDAELTSTAVRYCVPCTAAAGAWRQHPFGPAFRRARIEREEGIGDVAYVLGLFPAQVASIERGTLPPPPDEAAIARWAKAIDMPLAELMGRIEREAVRIDERGAAA